ncbi:peroxiredoxin-like family protein [uncultured Brevibacillus sp.]|uniref:peroxiredoxin-like family protein n=1 Tax=uncultured Brevibacillus sp. TaxID=169970 RepID=UPI002598AB3B|nr:peroxiredoxin-like family protein [uncultured Brevibacillus sp.]
MTMKPVQILQDALDEATLQMKNALPTEVLEAFEIAIEQTREAGLNKGVSVGTKAPDFTLASMDGQQITLSAELEKGPVVLVFYRGVWCPFCNLELRAYEQIFDEIAAVNGRVIAISPQTAEYSSAIQEKHGLRFPVVSDVQNQTAKKYELTSQMPEKLKQIYRSIEISLDVFNGDDSWELPLPATYVIDREGIIHFASVDADYKKRVEPGEVLRLLQALQRDTWARGNES